MRRIDLALGVDESEDVEISARVIRLGRFDTSLGRRKNLLLVQTNGPLALGRRNILIMKLRGTLQEWQLRLL